MDDKDEILIAQDIADFANEIRDDAIQSFCESLESLYESAVAEKLSSSIKKMNPEDLVTQKQTIEIIKHHADICEKGIVLNVIVLSEILTEIQSAACGTALSKVAAEGELECSWNSQTNEMEFWRN